VVIWIIIFTGIITMLLVKDLFSSPLNQMRDTNQPITLRYVQSSKSTVRSDPSDLVSLDAIQQPRPFNEIEFWATNHTTNAFMVYLDSIEIKEGSNWVTQPDRKHPLLFHSSGNFPVQADLGPHKAGYATIAPFFLATGVTWRAKARVAPLLTGFSDTKARVRQYPDTLLRRFQTGNTNITLNPFSEKMNFYGKGVFVFTEEISQQ
jgi:hypothetical protein